MHVQVPQFNPLMINAVCTDIDGTLLNGERELSLRTIAAIKHIGHQVPVILASSRMPSAMTHLQKELGIQKHPMICYNGGYLLYCPPGAESLQVLDSVEIPLPVCRKILDLTAMCDVHVSLYHEDNWYARGRDQWTLKEQTVTKVYPTIMAFEDILAQWESDGRGAHKIMCMGKEGEIARLYALLDSDVGQAIHIYRSKSTYLELAPGSISKASGLRAIMDKCFGTDLQHVMAFGDNYNDIDMIRSVGYGVAVENARPELKAVAWQMAAAGKDDGVAKTIEMHFTPGRSPS